MMSPLSLELFAQDVVRERIQQARQDALAAQLPRSSSSPFSSPFAFAVRPDVVARQALANGLRALAFRLDPSLLGEPDLVVAGPR